MSDNWDGYLPSDRASEINREREAIYGDPAENYRMLADLISPILGMRVTPCQAAMIMVQVKVMREVGGQYRIGYNDNLEDICGFVNVLHKTKERYGSRSATPGAGLKSLTSREE